MYMAQGTSVMVRILMVPTVTGHLIRQVILKPTKKLSMKGNVIFDVLSMLIVTIVPARNII